MFFLFLQMASGLQSWVEDHSNITMFNFIAYPIFSKTPWYWLQTPQKTIKGKNSLSLSFSFKRAQLSVTHSATQKEKKKSLRNLVVSKWTGGEKLCIPPTTMVWYCSKWKCKHPTAAAAAATTTKQTCPASSLHTGLSEGYYTTVI